jgi:hypothetical protein
VNFIKNGFEYNPVTNITNQRTNKSTRYDINTEQFNSYLSCDELSYLKDGLQRLQGHWEKAQDDKANPTAHSDFQATLDEFCSDGSVILKSFVRNLKQK